MPDAGWFRDPQDPTSELYFDGQNWTTYRRPAAPPAWQPGPEPTQPWAPAAEAAPPAWAPAQQWQPAGGATQPWLPAATAGPWAAPGPAGAWAPPPPPRRRRRTGFIALGAALVVAAGVVTWLAWPGSDGPTITYQGKQVAGAAKVLTAAEASVRTYVTSRHGVENGDTRCYFSKPSTPAAKTPKTDVGTTILCGPLLFVDGVPAKPYVAVTAIPDVTGKKVSFAAPTALAGLDSQALPTDVKLVRPDGEKAPSGADGLSAPTPPPAAANVLTTAMLGPTPAPRSLANARMIGKATGFTLQAAGEIPRYGLADDARSAPPGQKLIAFQVSYAAGDVSSAGAAPLQIVIDGGTPKDVPDAMGGDEWIIAALPAAGSAVLQLKDGGFTQTLSLPDGKPGAHNLLVLGRRHRSCVVSRTATIPAHLSGPGGSADVTFHAKMTFASLDFWVPGHETRHAIDGKHAILTTNLIYTDSGTPGTDYGFEPAILRLKLPGGQVIRPRNIASHNRIFNIFTVPANFTRGTLQVTGSEQVDGVDLSIGRTASFPVTFPAG